MFLTFLLGGRLLEKTEHLPDHAELDETGPDREPKAACDQYSYQDISPNCIIKDSKMGVQPPFRGKDIVHGHKYSNSIEKQEPQPGKSF